MSASTALDWSPKPPVVPDDYPTQRYFCPPGNETSLSGVDSDVEGRPAAEVCFYRNSEDTWVRLSVVVEGGAGYASAHLKAEQLRAIARLCLDCAHDLETVPALERSK